MSEKSRRKQRRKKLSRYCEGGVVQSEGNSITKIDYDAINQGRARGGNGRRNVMLKLLDFSMTFWRTKEDENVLE